MWSLYSDAGRGERKLGVDEAAAGAWPGLAKRVEVALGGGQIEPPLVLLLARMQISSLGSRAGVRSVDRIVRQALRRSQRSMHVLSQRTEHRFALVLEAMTPEAGEEIAQGLVGRLLAGFSGGCARVTIGLSGYPEPAHEVATLVAQAKAALSLAGLRGGVRVERWDSAIGELAAGSEERAAIERARAAGVPYLALRPDVPLLELDAVLPIAEAVRLLSVPVAREGRTLTVAMVDPEDAGAIRRLSEATGYAIYPVASSPRDIWLALARLGRQR